MIKEFVIDNLPISPLVRKITSNKLNILANQAGLENIFSVKATRVYKELSLWLGLLILLLLYLSGKQVADLAVFAVLILGSAIFWPELLLVRIASKQSRMFERELPAIIERLRLQVLAGLPLEQAIIRLSGIRCPLLRNIFVRARQRLMLGLPLAEALINPNDIYGADLSRLILALKQGVILGVGVAATLEVQAQLVRARRLFRAEERARQAAVTITVPLVCCIFPSVLIIYLVPLILKVMHEL